MVHLEGITGPKNEGDCKLFSYIIHLGDNTLIHTVNTTHKVAQFQHTFCVFDQTI